MTRTAAPGAFAATCAAISESTLADLASAAWASASPEINRVSEAATRNRFMIVFPPRTHGALRHKNTRVRLGGSKEAVASRHIEVIKHRGACCNPGGLHYSACPRSDTPSEAGPWEMRGAECAWSRKRTGRGKMRTRPGATWWVSTRSTKLRSLSSAAKAQVSENFHGSRAFACPSVFA